MNFESLLDEAGELLSPSEYMRRIRPERFSDTKSKSGYRLGKDVLDHALATLTERNEHKTFETFARAVAQRTVCRNLRPATGPEGGGDGKIDSESYPVAEEINGRWLEGHSGDDSWAVSISAKKEWRSKVKKDAAAIVGTGRDYARILAFTNQNPSQKKRKDLEDALTEEHGIPVTIYDRSWLIEKTIDDDHGDLAYQHLRVGEPMMNARPGPRDVERQRELEETEAALQERDGIKHGILDAARLARSAALLARGLEKPKTEVSMYFARAEELAREANDRIGIFRLLYDRIWTDFFWYDESQRLLTHFEEMLEIVTDNRDSELLGKLATLTVLLVQLPRLSGLDWEQVFARIEQVRAVAEDLSQEIERRNNALYAESIIVQLDISVAITTRDADSRDEVYARAVDILKRSEGLAEFPLDIIHMLVEIGQKNPQMDSEAFDDLIEIFARTIGRREGEIAEGEIYYGQAIAKLENDEPENAIGYLGRALTKLAKDETHDLYSNILAMLAHAYSSIGLPYAARSVQLAAMVANVQASHRTDVAIGSRQTLANFQAFAWQCLKTGHFGDLMIAVLFVKTMMHDVATDDDQRAYYDNFLKQLDACLACAIVTLPDDEIDALVSLPDALDALQLWVSLPTLFYRLGKRDAVEAEGFVTALGGWEAAEKLFAKMAAQPAVRDVASSVIATADRPFVANSSISGVKIVVASGEAGLAAVIAEMVITGIEAFLATLLTKRRVLPQTDSFMIEIDLGDDFAFNLDRSRHKVSLIWPRIVDIMAHPSNPCAFDHLRDLLAQTLGAIFYIEDADSVLEEMIGEERAMERAMFYANVSTLRGRALGNPMSEIHRDACLAAPNANIHVPNTERPAIIADDSFSSERPFDEDPEAEDEEIAQGVDVSKKSAPDLRAKSHRDINLVSPINLALWDAASWRGILFAQMPEDEFPTLALMFENQFAGYRIFETWRERFGDSDLDDAIRVTVLTGIDAENPAHYRGAIGTNPERLEAMGPNSSFMMLNRQLTMEPKTTENLDRFVRSWKTAGGYRLAPVRIDPKYGPLPSMDVAIRKTNFHLDEAWRVGLGHPDGMLFKPDTNPVVPKNVQDPPYLELLDMLEKVTRGEPVAMGASNNLFKKK